MSGVAVNRKGMAKLAKSQILRVIVAEEVEGVRAAASVFLASDQLFQIFGTIADEIRKTKEVLMVLVALEEVSRPDETMIVIQKICHLVSTTAMLIEAHLATTSEEAHLVIMIAATKEVPRVIMTVIEARLVITTAMF